MVSTTPDLIITQDFLDGFKKNDTFHSERSYSLSEDYLFSSDGFIVVKVPTSRIKNLNDLPVEQSRDLENISFPVFDEVLDHKKIADLSDLIIEQKKSVSIKSKYRKLVQHECSEPVSNCSIAQGLLLGDNYDHCFNCSSNSPHNHFLESVLRVSLNVDKKESFKNASVKESDLKKVLYSSFMKGSSLDLIKTQFEDFNFGVYLSYFSHNLSK